MSDWHGLFFWAFLLLFGIVMNEFLPRARDEAGFSAGMLPGRQDGHVHSHVPKFRRKDGKLAE